MRCELEIQFVDVFICFMQVSTVLNSLYVDVIYRKMCDFTAKFDVFRIYLEQSCWISRFLIVLVIFQTLVFAFFEKSLSKMITLGFFENDT